MKRLAWTYRALQSCLAMGSLAALIASCGDYGAANETEGSSETNIGTAHQALVGKDGSFTVTGANTVLNQYSRITANVAVGATTVTVNDLAELTSPQFGALEAGDLVMLYQAQGATMDSSDSSTYGDITSLGNAGRYEFVSVAAIAGNVLTLDLNCGGLKHAYTAAGNVQAVRVPQLTSLTINNGASLVPMTWDGQRGGVVAVHVTGATTINGTGAIDVSAFGFRGGATDNDASNSGVTTKRSTVAAEGGEKGESIAGYQAEYDALGGRYCHGAPANGGGGGNANNAGGGGGANGKALMGYTAWNGNGVMDPNPSWLAAWQLDPAYASNGNARTTSLGGGRGGYTSTGSNGDALTQPPGDPAWVGDHRRPYGGVGGRPLDNDPAGGRIFWGGGGGAGDGDNGGNYNGGRGGGLLILLSDSVTGNGSIRANGADGSSISSGDGPGGGGGGGTILIQSTNLANTLSITAGGGLGGNETSGSSAFGPGGGGGGGFIAISGGTLGPSVPSGNSGLTNSPLLTEFTVNGATQGAPGNAGTLNGVVACIDPPDTTIPATEPSVTDDPTGEFVFASNKANATFECRIDGGAWMVCPANYTTPPLAEGTHRIEARANLFDTVDPTPAAYTWVVDTSPLVENCTATNAWSLGAGATGNQNLRGTAIDNANNVVIVGSNSSTVSFGGAPMTTAGNDDIILAKLDMDGNHLWSKQFGDAASQLGAATAIDGAGNVVIVGSMDGTVNFGGGLFLSAGLYDVFIAKFDAGGNHLWSNIFGTLSNQNGNAVAIDGMGNIVMVGSFGGAVDFGGGSLISAGSTDLFVAKFDASGNHLWSKRFGNASGQNATAVAIDGSNNVVVAGIFAGAMSFGGGTVTSAGNNDVFLVKLDASGNHIWSKSFGSTSAEQARATAIDSAGNIAVVGLYGGSIDFGGGVLTNAGNSDIFVAKFDASGNHLWSKGFGDANAQAPTSTKIDSTNDIVVAGSFVGTVDFGGGLFTSAGTNDVFVAKFDPNGVHIWSQAFGGTGTDLANAVAVNDTDDVVIVGDYGGTIDFGNGPFANAGGSDVFVAKLEPCGSLSLGSNCTADGHCASGFCTDGVCCQVSVCLAPDQCQDVGTCQAGTGMCFTSNKPDGLSCNDNDACTLSDTCLSGTCTGANPVTCAASDPCHDVGTCDPMTGTCSNPNKADGSSCDDNDACTQSDTCLSGTCTGANPVTCAASDPCHDVGTCDPMTGLCSDPTKADGSSCNDNDACTLSDTCISGTCTGANPVTCAASDPCHDVGTCDPMTGLCSNPNKADGSSCNDNDGCTQTDTCISGTCTGANPITCAASDPCHDVGTCNPTTGSCSNPNKVDGSSCNDNDACTLSDTCLSGTCTGANPVTCVASDECETAGACNAATGACENIPKADGTFCSEGTCQKGKCLAQCYVDADCGVLFECTRFHQCQPLTEGPLDAVSGCSYAATGSSPMSSPISMLALIALGALRLRRRHHGI